MSEVEKLIVTVFGGIIAIAAISVIVGSKSKAPAAIQSFGSAMANIVGAAVGPANTGGNGNLGLSAFTAPFTGIK